MALSPSIRIDSEVHAAAVTAASAVNRSAAQQVSHWARIGRELEASDSVSASDIARVLDGSASYDDLNPHEQAVVRAEWAERTEQRRLSLDLVGRFRTAGRPYAECDSDGNTVRRDP